MTPSKPKTISPQDWISDEEGHKILNLLGQLLAALDDEFHALRTDNLARLKTAKLIQQELQLAIDKEMASLKSTHALRWGQGSDATIEINQVLEEAKRRMQRNLQKTREIRDLILEELHEMGKIRRLRRKFFPEKTQNSTPVFLDIRR